MREVGVPARTWSLAGCLVLAPLALSAAVFVELRAWDGGTIPAAGLPLLLLGPATILWAGGSTLRTLRDGTIALPLSLVSLGAGILATYLAASRPVFDGLGW
jgi:hypothetical protein